MKFWKSIWEDCKREPSFYAVLYIGSALIVLGAFLVSQS